MGLLNLAFHKKYVCVYTMHTNALYMEYLCIFKELFQFVLMIQRFCYYCLNLNIMGGA